MPSTNRRVALVGECMIELKETIDGRLTRGFGGDTFNTAAYMARLGRDHGLAVDYVSAVGDDRFSAEMVDFWQKAGVGTDLVRVLPGRRAGLYFITVDERGERRFTYWRGEAAVRDCFEGDGAEALLAALGDHDLVYVSGISLAVLHPTSRERLLARLEEIAAAGVAVAFDCNHRPVLWNGPEEARAVWERVFAVSRFVLATVEELEILGVPTTAAAGVALFARRWPAVELVIKDGAGPCTVLADGAIASIPATRVERVVDTTAAGDSFSAAYLLGRLLGRSVEASARAAHAVAGAVVQHPGAIVPAEAVPDVFADPDRPLDAAPQGVRVAARP